MSSSSAPPIRIRVGGIDYLNAQPLLYGLEEPGEPPLEVSHHPPSELARLLGAGALDVALLPVVASLERAEYRIVPGISIASYGAVGSIRLYHRRPLDSVRSVALDACSRTSALLTRLLFRELWGGRPLFQEVPPAAIRSQLAARPPAEAEFEAALLIGDAALSFHHGQAAAPQARARREVAAPGGRSLFPGWEDVDLGTAWTRWTGLPFVYAFWVLRSPDLAGAEGLVRRLIAGRDCGRARIDEIVARARLPEGMLPSELRRYLAHVIRYDLGRDELAGLRSFFERLAAAGLIPPGAGELRFLEEAPERPEGAEAARSCNRSPRT
jgi:chorismate dehydratase